MREKERRTNRCGERRGRKERAEEERENKKSA